MSISDFKAGYQPRTNVVKDETRNLVADSHSILCRWRNHSLSNSMRLELMTLGRQRYIRQSH